VSDIAASFRRPFDAQVAAYRRRLGNLVPTARWDDLSHAEHDRAFVVAGAVKADLLADLGAAVDRAISEGTGFEAFKTSFRTIVEQHGWHGWTGEGTARGEAWRMRVIYRTNMLTSYAAGRMAQLVDGKFKFWVYRHGNALEPRLLHLAWNGIALPPDHPFWATHYPPNDWGCTCYVTGARTEAGIRRVGGDPGKQLPDGWEGLNPKTGTPAGVGKGWDYAPGASAVDDVLATVVAKLPTLPAPIGSDLAMALVEKTDEAWQAWVTDTLAGKSHQPGLAGVMSQDVIKALVAEGHTPASAEIMVQPGLLAGPKAKRHNLAGDALTADQWLALPELLRKPKAVLRDSRSGNLIYLLQPDGPRMPQLAVVVDYQMKIARVTVVTNMVVSAYQPTIQSLRGRLAGGLSELLLGVIE